MNVRYRCLLVVFAVFASATLPLCPARATAMSAATVLPRVISAADGSAFLEAAPVDGKAWRFVFFGSGVATAAITVTAKTQAECACVRVHHNFPALLYAQATPLGGMSGVLGLDATLNSTGFVGPIKAAIGVPGGDNAEMLVSHYLLNTPMSAGSLRQARLVAGAVESVMFAQHWPVLYFWSTRGVRATYTDAAFGSVMAHIFAAKAGTAQVAPAGPPGRLQRAKGVPYYDDAVMIGYEASATISGKLSHRGVTLNCRVHITWDDGAWRYGGLPCAPAVYTAWFPQR